MSELPPLPQASRYATYNGICQANLGSMRGPNTLGEYMVVVSVEVFKDGDKDKTRIGFAYAGFGNKMFANHVLPEAVLNNNGS